MSYCIACGMKIESGESICTNCGRQQQPEGAASPHQPLPVRKRRKLPLILISLAVMVVVVGVVLGAIMLLAEPVVTVPGDHSTIQAAIDAATDGDVIVVSPGTYRENIDFKGKAITLRSTAPDNPQVVAATIIHGGNNGPVVTFINGETSEAVLTGFTITGGRGGQGEVQGGVGEEEREIEGYSGGGIFVAGGSSPTISGNTITGNTANRGGGISVVRDSSPAIIGNTIADNRAGWGGGGIVVMHNSSPTITRNTITGNAATWHGGGIYVVRGSSPTIRDNTVTGNRAGWGGGIAVWDVSAPTLTDNNITDNTADEGGGGVTVASGSSSTITGNTITDNRAGRGGGIAVWGVSSSSITGNTVTGNRARRHGGAIWVQARSTLHLNTPDDNIYRGNVPDNIYYE